VKGVILAFVTWRLYRVQYFISYFYSESLLMEDPQSPVHFLRENSTIRATLMVFSMESEQTLQRGNQSQY